MLFSLNFKCWDTLCPHQCSNSCSASAASAVSTLQRHLQSLSVCRHICLLSLENSNILNSNTWKKLVHLTYVGRCMVQNSSLMYVHHYQLRTMFVCPSCANTNLTVEVLDQQKSLSGNKRKRKLQQRRCILICTGVIFFL